MRGLERRHVLALALISATAEHNARRHPRKRGAKRARQTSEALSPRSPPETPPAAHTSPAMSDGRPCRALTYRLRAPPTSGPSLNFRDAGIPARPTRRAGRNAEASADCRRAPMHEPRPVARSMLHPATEQEQLRTACCTRRPLPVRASGAGAEPSLKSLIVPGGQIAGRAAALYPSEPARGCSARGSMRLLSGHHRPRQSWPATTSIINFGHAPMGATPRLLARSRRSRGRFSRWPARRRVKGGGQPGCRPHFRVVGIGQSEPALFRVVPRVSACFNTQFHERAPRCGGSPAQAFGSCVRARMLPSGSLIQAPFAPRCWSV
jgi:hypothetical protein